MGLESFQPQPIIPENEELLKKKELENLEVLEVVSNEPEVDSGSGFEDQEQRESTIEKFQEERGTMLTDILTSEMTSNSLDLVPFAGGGKMMVESIAGKTLSGEELSGKDRIIHGAMGAGSLALDFTGIGEAKDVAVITGKSIGLVEKVGAKLAEKGSVNGAKIFERSAQFMADHSQLTSQAEQFAEGKIREQIQDIKDYRAEA
jgi:hypothetical protein